MRNQKTYKLTAELIIESNDGSAGMLVEKMRNILKDQLISVGTSQAYLDNIQIEFRSEQEKDLSHEKSENWTDEHVPQEKGVMATRTTPEDEALKKMDEELQKRLDALKIEENEETG